MSTKNGNKGSYVVMLEQAKQPPKFIKSVVPAPGKGANDWLVKIIHPNTRKTVLEKEISGSLNDAFAEAERLLNSAELKESPDYSEPWYEETLFIPNPKRGKMKLRTKEAVEEEMNEALDDMDDGDDYNFDNVDEDDFMDEPKAKVAKSLKTEKKDSKAPKTTKKATKAPKKAKTAPKKNIKKSAPKTKAKKINKRKK